MEPAAGLALFFTTLLLRGASANRHVRGRLIASSFAFAAYALIAAAVSQLALSSALLGQLAAIQPLLLAFGVINAAVALIINPWRADRLPDRFPTIVQDFIVIGLFAVAMTVILQDRIFATTAVGAVVIGFALQDTLGNLFAGLAIQIEKPFRVGHWVNVAGKDGMVSEVTWRATKIRTKAGNFVIVPNSALARDTITNYSEPIPETLIDLDIGASYDTPPNQVKATILEAIKSEPLLAGSRQPEVLLADFAASAVTYRIRAWTSNFALDDVIRDRIRTTVYYAFRRTGIVIPYPIQVEMRREDMAAPAPDPATAGRLLDTVQIFATLPVRRAGTSGRGRPRVPLRGGGNDCAGRRRRELDVRRGSRRDGGDPESVGSRSGSSRAGRLLRGDVAADGRAPNGLGDRRHGRGRAGNYRGRVPPVRAGESGGRGADRVRRGGPRRRARGTSSGRRGPPGG